MTWSSSGPVIWDMRWREEAIKERLYEAYKRSGKTVDFIIDFIDNADDEDDFWA